MPPRRPPQPGRYNDCCAICRESLTEAKVLPCGHCFHYNCLRSWVEKSDSCPTCRTPLGPPPHADADADADADVSADGAHRGRGARAAQGAGAPPLAPPSAATAAAHALLAASDDESGGQSDEGEISGDEGDGRESDASAHLLFSTEHWRRLWPGWLWPSWLPRLQLEIVRRRPAGGEGALYGRSAAEELAQLRELFPSLPEAALRRELLRHGSMQVAVEQLLDAGDGDAG